MGEGISKTVIMDSNIELSIPNGRLLIDLSEIAAVEEVNKFPFSCQIYFKQGGQMRTDIDYYEKLTQAIAAYKDYKSKVRVTIP